MASHINDTMSETWKHTHIDDWSCEDLQEWIISIKLGSKNQKKMMASIKEQECTGEDFNSIEDKSDIMDSFPEINAMSGNKIYAALKNVRNSKFKKKSEQSSNVYPKLNKKPMPSDSDKNNTYPKLNKKPKKVSETWKSKPVNTWTSQELQDWMGSIGLNAKDARNIQSSIDMQGVEGEDICDLDSASDICDSFDGINKNIATKILAELNKLRRIKRRNSNSEQYNEYEPNNDQYSDAPFSYQAQQSYTQYSDSPFVNQNSERYKIDRIKQNYPELDDDTCREVLSRHNNSLQQTLAFIAQKKRQMQEEESDAKRHKDVEDIADMFGSLLSLAVVEEAGFVLAKPQNILEVIRRLVNVTPSGLTALRDAVVIGIVHMLKIKAALVQIGSLKHKFVHIVLTDGEDTASKQSLNDLQGFFHKLGRELGDMCCTYFIGVGLDAEEKEELESISRIGGKSCDLLNCDEVKIGDVFDRIAISMGITRDFVAVEREGNIVAAVGPEQLEVHIQEQKFLVLFTLDISASMLDGRWDKVVQAVAGFMAALKPNDIVGAIVFNERCLIVTDK